MKERKIDKILKTECKICGVAIKVVDMLFIYAIWMLGLMIRIKMINVQSADYYGFLKPWMDKIRAQGGFTSLKYEISNYTSPYMYLMCLISAITGNDLAGLKCVSYVFDYAASVAVFLIVWKNTANIKRAILGMSLIVLSPAVILDSAYWCQCDIIYTCLILYGLYFIFKKNSRVALILIGIAFSFKLQTLFIMPFLLILWIKNDTVRFRDFIWLPVMYLVMHIPAWLMGRPINEIVGIYLNQSDTYPWGTLNYPNIYALLNETIDTMHHPDELSSAGMWACIAVLGVVAYGLYHKSYRHTAQIKLWILVFTLSLTVYFLPHMHERYGFLIDLLLIVIASISLKELITLALYSAMTVMMYMPYLTGQTVIDLKITAIFNTLFIIYFGYRLYKLIKAEEIIREDSCNEQEEKEQEQE